MLPAAAFLLSFTCVTPLYFLFFIQHNTLKNPDKFVEASQLYIIIMQLQAPNRVCMPPPIVI